MRKQVAEIMKVKAMIRIAIVMVAIARPSWAQSQRCWNRIAGCVAGVEAGQLTQCCPVLREEVINQTECFCGISSFLDGNSTTMRTVSTFLSTCEIASSFDSVCPGSGDVESPSPPSTPTQPPPSDDSSLPPPRTSSPSPPLYDHVPESNPYPNSPPRLDSEPSANQGLLVKVLGPVGAVILVIILVLLKIFFPKHIICSCVPRGEANANSDGNPAPPVTNKK